MTKDWDNPRPSLMATPTVPDRWTRTYMDLARWWGQRCSKDPTSKVGAVLVGLDRRNLALGYNGFPPGVEDTEERLRNRPTKHVLTQHAERNVLDNAGFSCVGATLVTTRFPCHECAKSIVLKGVVRVVSPDPSGDPAFTDPVWGQYSEWAWKIMDEAGVQVVIVRDDPDPDNAAGS